jgi:hypothetical protein
MAEHPILMNGPAVRLTLKGLKTQDRRVVAMHNSNIDGHGVWKDLWNRLDFSRAWVDPGPSPGGNPGPYLKTPTKDKKTVHRIYPRVFPDDILWVRESWQKIGDCPICYASGTTGCGSCPSHTWRASIHMPKWACRIRLKVIRVWPHRLQDISEEEAGKEGVADRSPKRNCFRVRWNSYCKSGHIYDLNPWVWAYEYRKL